MEHNGAHYLETPNPSVSPSNSLLNIVSQLHYGDYVGMAQSAVVGATHAVDWGFAIAHHATRLGFGIGTGALGVVNKGMTLLTNAGKMVRTTWFATGGFVFSGIGHHVSTAVMALNLAQHVALPAACAVALGGIKLAQITTQRSLIYSGSLLSSLAGETHTSLASRLLQTHLRLHLHPTVMALAEISDMLSVFAGPVLEAELGPGELINCLQALAVLQVETIEMDECAQAAHADVTRLPSEALRFMRCSLACNGYLGGKALGILPVFSGPSSDIESAQFLLNLAASTGDVAPDSTMEIIHFETEAQLCRPAYLVAVDRQRREIVISIRGTITAHDLLTDLVCRHVTFQSHDSSHSSDSHINIDKERVPGEQVEDDNTFSSNVANSISDESVIAKPYCHCGMLRSAQAILDELGPILLSLLIRLNNEDSENVNHEISKLFHPNLALSPGSGANCVPCVEPGDVFSSGITLPFYDLVVVGHSLGAGVAALLTELLNEQHLFGLGSKGHDTPMFSNSTSVASACVASDEEIQVPCFRSLRCWAFAEPCVLSLERAREATARTNVVIVGYDVVSRFGLGSIHDLRESLLFLAHGRYSSSVDFPPPPPSCSAAELDAYLAKADRDALEHASSMPISATVLKLNQTLSNYAAIANSEDRAAASHLEMSALVATYHLKRIHAEMIAVVAAHQHEKLYPAGLIYWLRDTSSATVTFADQSTFAQMVLTAGMFSSHMPAVYLECIEQCLSIGQAN